MRIAFFGSGSPMSALALDAVAAHGTVVAVVVPAAVRGRGPRALWRALARRRLRGQGRLNSSGVDHGQHLIAHRLIDAQAPNRKTRRRATIDPPALTGIAGDPALIPSIGHVEHPAAPATP